MGDSQTTRASLLVRMRDVRDAHAWSQFVEVYSPLVYRFARRKGLQDADAVDVAQEVFRTVARSIGGFRGGCGRGSFRSWLSAVTRSKVCDFLAKRGRQACGSGDTGVLRLIEEQPSTDDREDDWEQERRKCVLEWAVAQIRGDFRDTTWQAFWQTNVEGKETKHVAESLGMTLGAVYIARSRVLARLKEQVRLIEG